MSESNQLTAQDVIDLFEERAQWCRQEGESDMRNIVHMASSLRSLIEKGKSREEILAYYAPDDEE